MANTSGQGNSIVNVTLDDDNTPRTILGVFNIPTNLRAYSILVIEGEPIINNIQVPTGFTLHRQANPGETLPGFTMDCTNCVVVFDSLREA